MLLQLALLGTANAPSTLPDLPEGVRGLIPTTDIEQQLLLAAGMMQLYREAGRLPICRTLPPPAPEEQAHQPSPAIQSMLDECLHGEWPDWWPHIAERLTRHGYVVRTEKLVATLNAIKPQEAPRWLPLLGQRGRWLAQHNPAWSWVLSSDAHQDRNQQWMEGSPQERLDALLAQRAEDCAVAREWLKAVWKGEKAETRQALLDTFLQHLEAADESFLETCLGDRSQAVRATAAGLLSRLPGSQLSKRLSGRAMLWIRWQPAAVPQGALGRLANKLIGKGNGQLLIEPASTWDKQWGKEGCEEIPPQGEGARAFWLRQLLAYIPPGSWETHTGLSPDAFIEAALASEWAESMTEGLTAAVQRFQDPDWALALYRALPAHTVPAGALLSILSPEQREMLCIEQLRRGNIQAATLLAGCACPWKSTLDEVVANTTRVALRPVNRDGDEMAALLALCEQAALNLTINRLAALLPQWRAVITALEPIPENWRAQHAAGQFSRQVALIERRMQFDKEIAP